MPKPKRISWIVAHGTHRVFVREARTSGAAARQAFRWLIRRERIKRQPKTDPAGGFEQTAIAPFSAI